MSDMFDYRLAYRWCLHSQILFHLNTRLSHMYYFATGLYSVQYWILPIRLYLWTLWHDHLPTQLPYVRSFRLPDLRDWIRSHSNSQLLIL